MNHVGRKSLRFLVLIDNLSAKLVECNETVAVLIRPPATVS